MFYYLHYQIIALKHIIVTWTLIIISYEQETVLVTHSDVSRKDLSIFLEMRSDCVFPLGLYFSSSSVQELSLVGLNLSRNG